MSLSLNASSPWVRAKPAVLGLCVALAASGASGKDLGLFGVSYEYLTQPPSDTATWFQALTFEVPPSAPGAVGPGVFLVGGSPLPGDFWVGALLPDQEGFSPVIIGSGDDLLRGDAGIGDFDGDGWADLVALGSQNATVFPFDGQSFGTPSTLGKHGLLDSNSIRTFIDLDGDGRAELVGVSGSTLRVRWSSRATEPWEVFELGFSAVAEAMADFTGDGIGDILLRRLGSAEFVLMPGSGTDSLDEPISMTAPVNTATLSVADLNGDGLPEIVLAGSGGVTVMLAKGGGDFVSRFIPRDGGIEAFRVIGDIDGDGRTDAIVRSRNSTFGARVLEWVWRDPLADEPTALEWVVEGRSQSTANFVGALSAVFVRDMNQDGLDDLVSITSAITVDYQISNPASVGGTRLGAQSILARRSPTHINPVDLDSDGFAELIVTSDRSPRLYRRDLTGGYTEEDLGGAASFMSVVADFNADGWPDLLTSTGLGSADFYPGVQGGGFAELIRIALPAGALPLQIATGDLNADGVPDAAIIDGSLRMVHILLGQTGGPPALAASIADDTLVSGLAIADIDGDGLPEIVVGQVADSVRVLRGSGGSWVPGESVVSLVFPYWLTAADFDADGFEDVLVTPRNRGPFRILYGSPAGLVTHDPWIVPFSGSGTLEAASADLTGNGLLDVIATSTAAETAIYLQVAPREFVLSGRLPSVSDTGVALADVNADGVIDAVTVSGGNRGWVKINYGTGNPPCPADLDANGQVNFFDMLAYLALYNDQAPGADLAEPIGSINFFDLLAYLNLFNAGCP